MSTPIAPEVDGDAAAVSDEPVSTEPVSTVQGPEISVSGLETSDPIPVQGLDDALEEASTSEDIGDTDAWSPLPPWLRAVEGHLEPDAPTPQPDDEADVFEPTASLIEPEPASQIPDRSAADEGADAIDPAAEGMWSAPEELSYDSLEAPRWQPESAEEAEAPANEAEPVELGSGDLAGATLDGPWRLDAEPWESFDTSESSAAAMSEGTSAEATASSPPTLPDPASDPVERLARRLEQLAATLRESGTEALARPTSDPLGALIAAYLLGSTENSGASNDPR